VNRAKRRKNISHWRHQSYNLRTKLYGGDDRLSLQKEHLVNLIFSSLLVDLFGERVVVNVCARFYFAQAIAKRGEKEYGGVIFHDDTLP